MKVGNVKIKRWLILTLFFASPVPAENTLVITLINDSTQKFVFERVAVEFPDNTLSISRKILMPGDVATINGNTTTSDDLSGMVYFSGGPVFWIVDKLQFHVGPPIFAMDTNTTTSTVISKTPNSHVGARLLSYVAAKVVLKDRLRPPTF
jgi:hypothetical protein